ncbi:MAG: 50S ribosomal protein L18 [Parcubacteria group bacterium 21-54-25]|nr:MAG: 50S ribosomal protein L18 [Parcubacteria group bacterium 21-54-25]HQU08253.1 50S ribosomal protein L18 [Candidatus Paceibacterota bacterium]
MATSTTKHSLRIRRHARVRARVTGTKERPRLAVFKSNRFISAQLIDDVASKTLASAHGREFGGAKLAQAEAVGKSLAARAKKTGITTVVFDRGGYAYAARVKALADAARAGGLAF